jgi:hypothetical protein
VPGQHCLLAEGNIGALIYWRTDPPCANSVSTLKKEQPARQHAGGVEAYILHVSIRRTEQFGAPPYFQTNRLLIELYKQETEIDCRKDDGNIKK